MTDNRRPLLRGHIVRGDQIAVYCPWCLQHHYHGATSDLKKGRKSHKAAHCFVDSSPFLSTGYYVAKWRKSDPEMRKINEPK